MRSATVGHVLIGHWESGFWTTHLVRSAPGTTARALTAGEGEGSENGEAQCGEGGFQGRFHGVDFHGVGVGLFGF